MIEAGARVEVELGRMELVDRVVFSQHASHRGTEVLTDEEGINRALVTAALVGTTLLVAGAAELTGAADDRTTEDEATAELDWILDATPPTASVAAPTGVAGLAVTAAGVWISAEASIPNAKAYCSSRGRRSTVGRLNGRQLLRRQSPVESVFHRLLVQARLEIYGGSSLMRTSGSPKEIDEV